MRQLGDGAGSLLRLQSGMSRDPARDQLVPGDSLAPGLRCSPGKRRLQHQHRGALRGFGLDQITRGRASTFLVAGEQDLDWMRPRQVELADRLERGQHDGHAALHVEDAGAVGPPLLDPERPLAKRPSGPHRVDVTEEHDRRGSRSSGHRRSGPAGAGRSRFRAVGWPPPRRRACRGARRSAPPRPRRHESATLALPARGRCRGAGRAAP